MPILNATSLIPQGPAPYNFKHFAAATSLQLKTMQGALGAVFVNTVGTTPVITLYDETDGSATAADIIGSVAGSAGPQFIPMNVWFTKGLFVVLTGSGFSITVTYL